MNILGIDIAKRTFNVALLRDSKLRHKKFPNTPDGFKQLAMWLSKQGATTVHACQEATGNYGEALALNLHNAGHIVSIVNPARIKAFGQAELQRNKTDRVDAALIARFCELHKPSAWAPPAPEIRELQALVRHLDSLIETRVRLDNRLHNAAPVEAVIESLRTLIDTVNAQIAEIEQKIRDHFDHHADLKACRDLLTSIPGIAATTAAKLLAEIEHLRDYNHSRQAVAYAGLSPRLHQSGESVRRARLSKTGNAHIRKALYWPAITALRCNPLIQQLSERLTKRGKCKMVIVGAAMRKLLHLAFGVLKTRRPFDPNHATAA